jgi:hypothetical protein
MNEFELQGIANPLDDVTERMRVTRMRLAGQVSEPPSAAQRDRLTTRLDAASAEIRLMLDYLAAEAWPPEVPR